MPGPSSTSRDASTTPTRFVEASLGARTLHRARLVLARRLAALRLHRLTPLPHDGERWLCKRRTRFAELLVRPGNLYLHAQGALSEVLVLKDWIAWELRIAECLQRNLRVSADHRGIEFPVIPGCSLEELLRSSQSLGEKLCGVTLCATALRMLHERTISADGDAGWCLSHGDATCRNVVVDLATNTANWIDFDMRHRPGLSQVTRHADDLRALLWSSAAWLNPAGFPACIEALAAGYPDKLVWVELQRMMSHMACPSVFQLSQAALSVEGLAGLRAEVRYSRCSRHSLAGRSGGI